ncbi:MAG: CBS domain-containing protein [Candidatus Omnitrophica bacterium]|nr:CBS domain-containing protein [Candidatus Omnitrophota bacterium]MDE2009256.1 CBS domain-containing protein [Candidatus Omnitrophota bacterium]MDE2213776.1 CBS domain-containing protein [Candidatus Omnitrophota bacterium]MDE2230648.1 CBS domain-containing protein [Candidatus Omnitrophota bacterium]
MVDIKQVEHRSKSVKAADLMSRFAITIKEGETVMSLAHLMMRFKISGVPVIDKNGEICGIATATDLFNLMKKIVVDIEQGKNSVNYSGIKVSEIMTSDVVTINEETTLYDMMKLMCARNIHTLPVMVISKKEIVGVIGRRDIINAFYVGTGDYTKPSGKG